MDSTQTGGLEQEKNSFDTKSDLENILDPVGYYRF